MSVSAEVSITIIRKSICLALIPRDEAKRWRGFLRTARCDSADHYDIGAVRPGEYYIVAFGGDEIAALRINQLTMDGNIAPLVPEDVLSQGAGVYGEGGRDSNGGRPGRAALTGIQHVQERASRFSVSACGHLIATTIESGPTSASTRVSRKPAFFIQPLQSALE